VVIRGPDRHFGGNSPGLLPGFLEVSVGAPAHILIVDDHPLFVEALQRTIVAAFPDAKTREAVSIEAAKSELEGDSRFDIVLLDLSLPGTRGFEGLLELRTLHPKLPIVVVSALEDARIVRDVMRYGAAGFISKSADRAEIAEALKNVMEGSLALPKGYSPAEVPPSSEARDDLVQRLKTLTPKQLSVLRMLRHGLLNKQIAHELQIEETTVKAHVSEILRKLNVSSRTQAVIEAQKIDFESILGQNG
jgi:DNA-binding NarL/FixJ family response regulator